METINLKVPKGDKCIGCMFLDYNAVASRAVCRLFNKTLHGKKDYGYLIEKEIKKYEFCLSWGES